MADNYDLYVVQKRGTCADIANELIDEGNSLASLVDLGLLCKIPAMIPNSWKSYEGLLFITSLKNGKSISYHIFTWSDKQKNWLIEESEGSAFLFQNYAVVLKKVN